MGRGSTRRWRRLRAQVLRDEPYCQLQLPMCTTASTTVDHIKPVVTHPHLEYVRDNLQGACAPCNYFKGDRELHELDLSAWAGRDDATVADFFG